MMKAILAAAAFALSGACAAAGQPPIRFVLTFDDGPAPTTATVLDTLARNPVQPGAKAIFFVQTRAGGSADLMRRTYAEGHLLAVHTGTAQGHVSHMALSTEELEQSLAFAKADIASLADGAAPHFVRPPFWFYDRDTLACYERAGLAMLLTDITARDGTVLGINLVPGKELMIRAQLERIKQEVAEGELPVLDGAVPVVATFHDVNSSTARNLSDYLEFLVDAARGAGLSLAPRPFYDRREDLERAAALRARRL